MCLLSMKQINEDKFAILYQHYNGVGGLSRSVEPWEWGMANGINTFLFCNVNSIPTLPRYLG